MLKNLFYSFIIIALLTLNTKCANVTAPTGGPKDTIPPSLVNSIPTNKSINFKNNIIYLEFDERIKTDKLDDQLIITPTIDGKYEASVKKNLLKISFDEPFSDSITYTLNFRDGIQDITESNPTLNNKFTFSTGSFIDSLSVFGLTTSLLTADTIENVIVGLYKAEDTINIFNGSPYYFSQTNKEGQYSIENIKNGKYFIYAFTDANKNLKLDFNSESYAFKKDTLFLDSIPVELNFQLSKLDLTPFRQMTALPSGKYFEINFNKYVTEYTINYLDSSKQKLYSNLSKQNKSIRFYNHNNLMDSLQISYIAKDSLNSLLSDTVFVKFTESKRKTDDFSFSVKPKQGQLISKDFSAEINFNKPILSYNLDSFYFEYDTIVIQLIPDSTLFWNDNKDKLSFNIEIDLPKIDTLISQKRLIASSKDSIDDDRTTPKQPLKKEKVNPTKNVGFRFYSGLATFISADSDSSKNIGVNYKFFKPEEVGTQEIIANTQYDNYIIQLLTEKFELVDQKENTKTFSFNNLLPGKYRIRVLIDSNNDGSWSNGNMRDNEEPEPVYIYPETLIIRADWRTKLELTF